jgi:hypothetical protein
MFMYLEVITKRNRPSSFHKDTQYKKVYRNIVRLMGINLTYEYC